MSSKNACSLQPEHGSPDPSADTFTRPELTLPSCSPFTVSTSTIVPSRLEAKAFLSATDKDVIARGCESISWTGCLNSSTSHTRIWPSADAVTSWLAVFQLTFHMESARANEELVACREYKRGQEKIPCVVSCSRYAKD